MKKSDRNLSVIQNFILHLTHSSSPQDGIDKEYQTSMPFTPEIMYSVADEYIEEDHVDGKENHNDHIITYSAESSFDNEDKDKQYKEHIVVRADFGDEIGTETIATIDNIKNLKAINDLLKFIKENQ